MREEMNFLQRNQTCTLVLNPGDKKLVSYKWIFKRKNDILGVKPLRFKEKLLPRGFT